LLADARAEILYPPTWLNLVLPPWLYYSLFVVIHLVFSGVGLFLLARRWQASTPGAFTAALVWMSSGPLLSLVSMWHHLAGAAWIPWLFLATELVLDSATLPRTLLLGTALAGQILAGSPDFTILAGLPLAAYVLGRLLVGHWSRQPRIGVKAVRLGLGVAFGVALSACQWLPMLEMARRSERWGLTPGEATTWSLHPALLLEVMLPFHWNDLPLLPRWSDPLSEGREPWLHSVYVGVPALSLAAVGLVAPLTFRRGFLLGLAVAAALFSLGRHSIAHDLTVRLVSGLGMLRFPVKAMVLFSFACSLLAGLGLDVWRSRTPTSGSSRALGRLVPVLLLSALAAAAWLLATSGSELWGPSVLFRDPRWPSYREILAPTASQLARGACFGAVLLALAIGWKRVGPSWTPACLATLVAADLLITHRSLHPTAPRELFTIRPEALDALPAAHFQRLYVYDYSVVTPVQRARDPQAARVYRLARLPAGWETGPALVLGVHSYLNPPTAGRWGLYGSYDLDILGFYSKPLSQLVAFLRDVEGTPAHLRLLQLGAVANVLALNPAPWWGDLVPVATVPGLFEQPIRIFRVPDPLPRAYVVGDARVADGEAALDAITDPAFDPRRTVLLAGGPVLPPREPITGDCRILELEADRVRVEAFLSGPGYVVLVDAYDPGWRVFMDGREVPLLRANVAFRAVQVPAGSHQLEFRYRPRSVIVGIAVSALSLVAVGASLIYLGSRAGR
jgi:hypothetical protein